MNLFTFLMLIIGIVALYTWTFRALKNASIQEKMKKDLNTDAQYDMVKKFQKEHKDMEKKEEELNKFTNGGN